MLLPGAWLQCDDGESRPILRGAIQTAAGRWIEAPFLVDTGADQTVFSAAILSLLGLPTEPTPYQLLGVGGTGSSVLVRAAIHFTNEAGKPILFRGQFAAFTELESLDMCLLGRDITRLFAAVVDFPQGVVCLARPPPSLPDSMILPPGSRSR
jgi:hypothetical protein